MQIKDYETARSYLESLIPERVEDYEKISLGRMRALLGEMGNPQDSYPTVHVGGTAGKGSVATMISKIMEDAGYRAGLHVSPHLQDIRERMQVNGRFPGEKEFVDLVLKVRSCVERVEKGEYGRPSYFEALLAISFENFRREKADIAVVEVGMGGRLDGTNIITPKVVVLTNVGLDHTEFLGDTLEEIAHEKVGIFKRGVDVISGVDQPAIVDIVRETAEQLGCGLCLLGREIGYGRVKIRKAGSMFDLRVEGERYNDVELSMIGSHQISNAALAVVAALRLNSHGFRVEARHFRRALSGISVPGRFEIVRQEPIVIMDGAHNPMKIDALARAIAERYPRRKIFFVFATKKDKNVREMIGQLSRLAAKFYFTSFVSTTDFGRRMSYDPNDLKRFTDVESEVVADADEAYRNAIEAAGRDGIVCVTGSFYLVGELRN